MRLRHQTHLATAPIYLAGLAVALAWPGSPLHHFDGIPWNTPWEYAAVVALLSAAALRRVRARIGAWLARLPAGLRWLLLATLLVPVAVKTAPWSDPAEGAFAACYETLVAGEGRGCERSFDAPFAPSSVTRFDRRIDFESLTWGLGFVNSLRFNIIEQPGTLARGRLPFAATWRGDVTLASDATLVVHYAGEGTLTVGSQVVELAPSYGGWQRRSLAVPAGRHALVLRYRFDDGYRVGQAANPGAGPAMSLRSRGDGETEALVAPARPATPSARVAWIADAVLVGHVAVTLAAAIAVLGAELTLILAALAIGLAVWVGGGSGGGTPTPTVLPGQGLTDVLLVFVLLAFIRPFRARAVLLFWGVALLSTSRVMAMFPGWRYVSVRSGGNDWLTNEAHARTIVESWSLHGGESTFYLQPLYRYVLFLQRLTFGEAEVFASAFALLGLTLGLALVAVGAHRRAAAVLRPIVIASALASLAMMWSAPVLQLMLESCSEGPTWIALPYVFLILTGRRVRPAGAVFCAVLLALSAITRTNQLPAAASLAVMSLLSVDRRWRTQTVALGMAVFAAIALLPLAHNVVYGGQWVLTTASASIPENLVLPPRMLLSIFGDAAVGRTLGEQLAALLYLGPGDGVGTRWLFRLPQLIWLGTALVVLRRPGSRMRWAVALLPWLYLAPHVFYQTSVYYPRHIVIAHLAFGLSAAWLAVSSRRRRAFRAASTGGG